MIMLSAIAILLASSSSLNAALMINTSGSGAAGTIEISMPRVEFTTIEDFSGTTVLLVFHEAFANPVGNQNSSFTGPRLLGSTVNFYADAGLIVNDISENDAYIAAYGVPGFLSGSTVLFEGGTISMILPDPLIDIFPSGSYDVFLTTDGGRRFTEYGVAVVPEPPSLLIMALAFAFLIRVRKDKCIDTQPR